MPTDNATISVKICQLQKISLYRINFLLFRIILVTATTILFKLDLLVEYIQIYNFYVKYFCWRIRIKDQGRWPDISLMCLYCNGTVLPTVKYEFFYIMGLNFQIQIISAEPELPVYSINVF